MTIISSDSPRFVKLLDKELAKLIGFAFPLKRSYNLSGFDFHENLEPSKLAESAVYSALINVSSENNVLQEPNGYRSFPDFKVKFNNNFEYLFEVKSFISSSRSWSAATVSEFNRALENKDLKYFKAYYVDFNFKQMENEVMIRDILIGKINNFAPGDKFNSKGAYISSRAYGSDLENFIDFTIKDLETKEWAKNILLKN